MVCGVKLCSNEKKNGTVLQELHILPVMKKKKNVLMNESSSALLWGVEEVGEVGAASAFLRAARVMTHMFRGECPE